MQNDDDSEQDEQRMKARRRYSYEHIDGVGDDASSDSRGRTDQDSTDDLSKNEESSHDDDNESSQHTDVAGSDDGVGNRPLLEDDELEQDDEDVIHGLHTIRKFDSSGQLFINPNSRSTNPFLNNTDDTPKMSPAAQDSSSNYVHHVKTPSNWTNSANQDTIDGRWLDHRRDTLFEKPSLPIIAPLNSTYAPATLPRQATPLAAAPKTITKPFTQNIKSSSNIVSNLSLPNPQHTQDVTLPVEPVVGRLIQVAPLPPSKPPSAVTMVISQPTVSSAVKGSTASISVNRETIEDSKPPAVVPKQSGPNFIEGPKTPKPKKNKDKERKRMDSGTSGSELETDGSEAEMCTRISFYQCSTSSDKASSSKKKRKAGTFSLRGSNPSFGPTDLKSSAPNTTGVKKLFIVARNEHSCLYRKALYSLFYKEGKYGCTKCELRKQFISSRGN
uniref:BRCT domain-containing protein n=1 Tax=Heterorhabditis bacteriophora TaxID=37862 RepID=A0A1I7XDP0_HETBA